MARVATRPLWHPVHWPAWLGFALLRAIVLLPYAALQGIGRPCGRLARHLLPGRARIAARNLELCFPDLDADARERLLVRHFESLGVALFEIPFTWWAGWDRVNRLADISGLEHLQRAAAEGRGVLLLSAHFTSLEMGGRLLLRHAGFDALYRPSNNPVVEHVMANARRRGCGELIPRDAAKKVVRSLRNGRTVWYAPDQNTQRKKSVFVTFFDHFASTTPATHKLARMTGARVVPFLVVRKADGSGCRLLIEPPLEDFPSDDVVADTQRVNDIIERWVRAYPEQYLWIHRRFRSRPPSEPQKIY